MLSTAKDVTTYIQEAPAERQETLTRLRDLYRATLTGFEESMVYGGPCYKRNDEVEVGSASQKHFIGLYILRTDVMNAHKHLLKGKGITSGKGAIRYSNPERIDLGVKYVARNGKVNGADMLRSKKKKQAIKPLSFAWAMLVGLLSIVAQVVTFYVRFRFFNTQASFANYAAFFLAGTLGGSILIYFLNRESLARARRIVLIAFLLASPLALILMLAGGLFGPIGVLIAPQIPWALFTRLGALVSKRYSRG